MRKNNLFTMMMLCISLMFLLSCDEEEKVSNNNIIGSWQANEKTEGNYYLIINFYDDGIVVYESIKDVIINDDSLVGSYTYNNDIIELTDARCDINPGRYSVSFTGNMIKLEILNDSCDRSEIIPGTYTRK